MVSVNREHYAPAARLSWRSSRNTADTSIPWGAGWPKTPPNYIAFRWDGRLQSVHHVESYKIVETMESEFPAATSEEIDRHFLYTLGPPIMPAHVVRTGNIFPSGRVWVAIDLLLTSQTISDARDATAARHTRRD